MCHICCLHWIAALISIFTSWNVRLWIQVTRILPWTYIVITSRNFIWDTNIYIYLFNFNLADQNMPALDRRETIRLSIIQPWEKMKNMISLSVGINDHEIIFTIFFVGADISLVCLMLDVVLFIWCLLSGHKPMMHVKNPVFAILQFSYKKEFRWIRSSCYFFSRKNISWSGKANTAGAWNLLYF